MEHGSEITLRTVAKSCAFSISVAAVWYHLPVRLILIDLNWSSMSPPTSQSTFVSTRI